MKSVSRISRISLRNIWKNHVHLGMDEYLIWRYLNFEFQYLIRFASNFEYKSTESEVGQPTPSVILGSQPSAVLVVWWDCDTCANAYFVFFWRKNLSNLLSWLIFISFWPRALFKRASKTYLFVSPFEDKKNTDQIKETKTIQRIQINDDKNIS